ncbi:MAG: hypothetical protein AAF423_14140 [Pseudomonadota bacterium]
MNGAITYSDLAMLFALFGAVGGLWWKIHARISKAESALSDFKVQVAKEYATNKGIEQMESRVVDAIRRLGDRLDRVMEGSKPP